MNNAWKIGLLPIYKYLHNNKLTKNDNEFIFIQNGRSRAVLIMRTCLVAHSYSFPRSKISEHIFSKLSLFRKNREIGKNLEFVKSAII